MKLSLVTETYPPEINGVAMTLHHLASGLVACGHEVQVIRPRQKLERHAAGSHFSDDTGVRHWLVPGVPIPLYKSLRMGLPVVSTLQRLWRDDPPDIVHAATEGPLGLAAVYAASKAGRPITSSFHTNFHQYGGHYGLRAGQDVALRYLRWFHNHTRRTMVPTDEMQSQLAANGFRDLVVLSRGVDAKLFSPEKRSDALRRRWGAAPRDPVAIYVGRLAAEKNLELAVHAFLAMQALEPRAKFVLVGDGPQRAALQAEYPQFEYVGSQRAEALAAHYASADVFLFPSTTETFGNVITEALASGLVLLSFNYAAARQYVVSGENGVVAPLGDAAGYVDAACELIVAREGWPAMRARARATALSITWESIVSQFEAELRAAIEGTTPAERAWAAHSAS